MFTVRTAQFAWPGGTATTSAAATTRRMTFSNPSISRQHRGTFEFRALCLLAFAAIIAALRTFGPSLPGWSPSCGAITGLPCIFCGLTRAICFLLHGDWARALYFNWLAFPLGGAAVALALLFALELATGRILFEWRLRFEITGRRFAGAIAAVALLWTLQVYLAVSQHKTELLNPHGPLYALFVR